MIRRTFDDGVLFLEHSPPVVVRLLGAVTGAVNGLMALAGLLTVWNGEPLGVGLLLLGLVGVHFAAAMIFGGHTQRIDHESITQTWSLVVTLKRRVVRVADIDALVLTRTYRRVKYSVVTVDQLIATGPTTSCALLSSGTPEFALDVETIARVLDKPLRDERKLDTRALVRETQMKALPIAFAITIVLVCVLGMLVFAAITISRGPDGQYSIFDAGMLNSANQMAARAVSAV